MKIQHLTRIIIELALSFVIKRVVQVNLPITHNPNTDNIIYSIIAYGLILISIINLIQVIIYSKQGREKHKIGLVLNLTIFGLAIIIAIIIWQLIQSWLFWLAVSIIIIVYLIYYIKFRAYKKELHLYKRSIIKALKVEFYFKIKHLKVYPSSENFLLLTTQNNTYHILALSTDEMTISQDNLNTLNERFSIVQTISEDNYIQLRYLTFFVLQNPNDLVPLYTLLTS